MMTAAAAVNGVDVVSIVHPMSPAQLQMVPSYLTVELMSFPQHVKDMWTRLGVWDSTFLYTLAM